MTTYGRCLRLQWKSWIHLRRFWSDTLYKLITSVFIPQSSLQCPIHYFPFKIVCAPLINPYCWSQKKNPSLKIVHYRITNYELHNLTCNTHYSNRSVVTRCFFVFIYTTAMLPRILCAGSFINWRKITSDQQEIARDELWAKGQ